MAPKSFERWNIEEDKELLELYLGGTTYATIANKFGRTPHAIRLRLEHLCFNYYKTDMISNKDDILDKLHKNSKITSVWKPVKSRSTGKIFWYNEETKETTWQKPAITSIQYTQQQTRNVQGVWV